MSLQRSEKSRIVRAAIAVPNLKSKIVSAVVAVVIVSLTYLVYGDVNRLYSGDIDTYVITVQTFPYPPDEEPEKTPVPITNGAYAGRTVQVQFKRDPVDRVEISLFGIDFTKRFGESYFRRPTNGKLYRARDCGNWIVDSEL